jgi:hypothetical protein
MGPRREQSCKWQRSLNEFQEISLESLPSENVRPAPRRQAYSSDRAGRNNPARGCLDLMVIYQEKILLRNVALRGKRKQLLMSFSAFDISIDPSTVCNS